MSTTQRARHAPASDTNTHDTGGPRSPLKPAPNPQPGMARNHPRTTTAEPKAGKDGQQHPRPSASTGQGPPNTDATRRAHHRERRASRRTTPARPSARSVEGPSPETAIYHPHEPTIRPRQGRHRNAQPRQTCARPRLRAKTPPVRTPTPTRGSGTPHPQAQPSDRSAAHVMS